MTKSEAKALGFKTYYTGAPCCRGHVCERFTRSGQCILCARIHCQKWKGKNLERERLRGRVYFSRNKEKIAKKSKARYLRDPEKARAAGRASFWKDPETNRRRNREYHRARAEEMRAKWKIWASGNKERLRFLGSQRRCAELQATPPWADLSAIQQIYRKARALELLDGIKRHVDHKIPIKGRTVCGLHVQTNLQILTAKENLQKFISWPDDWASIAPEF